MNLAELLTTDDLALGFELNDAATLRRKLLGEPDEATLARLDAVLAGYAGDDPEAQAALDAVLESLARGDGKGDGFLLTGAAGSGKSHLLGTLLLLAGAGRARKRLARANQTFSEALRVIHEAAPLLVVPLPLNEHSGRDELLEDIIFERTEAELRREPHGIVVPLSQHSYALELIERHVVPRYEEELNRYTVERTGADRTWAQLRAVDEQAAVRVGHQFAQSIGYPLDFRQSRVERMARLLEIADGRRIAGVLYLIDDLGHFLASVEAKAVQGDLVFLEFLAQRGKIAPIWTVAALEAPLREIPGVEPHLARRISDLYGGTLALTAAHMRHVYARLTRPPDPARAHEALAELVRAQAEAFEVTPDPEAIAASFPLEPLAARCAEELAGRVLGRADGLLTVLRRAAESGMLEARSHLQPLTVVEVFELLLAQLRATPEAAPYVTQALEYYESHAAEVDPRAPDLLRGVVRGLIALRLANLWPNVQELRVALGVGPDGTPLTTPEELRGTLEAARLHGRFVEVRRGPTEDEDVYYVEVHTPLGDTLRERLSLARESITREDPRLVEAAVAHAGPAVPLAELVGGALQEVRWRNTARGMSVSFGSIMAIDDLDVSRRGQELADPANLATIHLYLGDIIAPEAQRARWGEITDGTLAGRWAASVLCWLPRPLAERELDALRDCAACRLLLGQRAGLEHEKGLIQRLEEEEARLGQQVREIVRAAYYEGTVLSAFGEIVSPGELARIDGDWSTALNTIAAWALDRIFPEFRHIAPRQLIAERTQIDELVDKFIRPGRVEADSESPLGNLIESVMMPLGLAQRENGGYLLAIQRGAAAEEVMLRIRARDQTPETRRGRPLACADLAEHLVKSELGLPPELFELLITALIRRGYLMALDAHNEPVQLADIPTPIARHLQLVARPALLSYEQWTLLSRICRIVFEQVVANPDHAAQAAVWEALIEARASWLARVAELRAGIEALRERLGQPASSWRESLAALGHIERFFELVEPHAYADEGLQRLLEGAGPYLETTNGVSKLRDLLRVVDLLEHFVADVGPQLIALQHYLTDDDLWLPEGSDLVELRDRLLRMIASGEEAVGEEQAFVRLAQVFFARYKRRYTAWHNAAHRASEFEPYNSLRASPEMRVLGMLDRLDLNVQHNLGVVNEQIERELAKRCREMNLSEALDRSPVCPVCGLRLGEELNLRPVAEIEEMARAGVSEYVRALASPANQRALAEYIRTLPHRGDTVRKLAQLVRLPQDTGARGLMPLLGDDVLTHLQRALTGQQVRARSLSELRRSLAGRTLTRKEIMEVLEEWVAGDDELDENDLLHLEP